MRSRAHYSKARESIYYPLNPCSRVLAESACFLFIIYLLCFAWFCHFKMPHGKKQPTANTIGTNKRDCQTTPQWRTTSQRSKRSSTHDDSLQREDIVPQGGDGLASISLTRDDITDLVREVVRSLTPTVQGVSNTPRGTSKVTKTPAGSRSGTSDATETHTQGPVSSNESTIPAGYGCYIFKLIIPHTLP